MEKIIRLALYILAFLMFLLVYAVARSVELAFLSMPVVEGSWTGSYLYAFFSACISGFLGIALAVTVTGWAFSKCRMRPLLWVIICLISILWIGMILSGFAAEKFAAGEKAFAHTSGESGGALVTAIILSFTHWRR